MASSLHSSNCFCSLYGFLSKMLHSFCWIIIDILRSLHIWKLYTFTMLKGAPFTFFYQKRLFLRTNSIFIDNGKLVCVICVWKITWVHNLGGKSTELCKIMRSANLSADKSIVWCLLRLFETKHRHQFDFIAATKSHLSCCDNVSI